MDEFTYLKLGGVPTVTLLVGEEKLPFHVHLDVICKESSVFKAAFSGEFTEASNKSMNLPDDDIESVDRMIQWLYSKQYELAKWSEDIKTTASARYWQLARLNTLADKYNIIGLSNNIIDQLYILHSKNVPPQLDVTTYIYDNTTENSSFRKLLIGWLCWKIDMKWYQGTTVRGWLLNAPELAVDVAIAFGIKASSRDQKKPFQYDKSTYYRQPEEVPTSNSK
ncbi:hypothetical protein MMC31_004603 [Peltigera leucophlebia]|nr:hypothetical protein [Peltigera leucophlebia]